MKNLLTAMALLLSLQSFSQGILVKVLKDDAKDVNSLIVTAELMTLDGNFKSTSAFSASIGANAYATIKNKIGAEAYARYGLLSLTDEDGLAKPIYLEAGAFFNFYDRTKNKLTKVVLSSERSGNRTTTHYVKQMAERRRLYGLRAGYLQRNFPMTFDGFTAISNPSGVSYKEFNAFTAGLYAGIQSTTIRNLFIKPEGYRAKKNSSITRYYIDVMLMPIWTASRDGVNLKSELKSPTGVNSNFIPFKYNPIGWRFGLDYRPADKGRNRDIGRAGAFYCKMEIGVKPIEGGFFTIGLGWTFLRQKGLLIKPKTETAKP